MSFPIVVNHLFEIFTRYVQSVRNIVVTARQDNFARSVAMTLVVLGLSATRKVPSPPTKPKTALVLVNFYFLMTPSPPVIFQTFRPARLLVQRGHRNIA